MKDIAVTKVVDELKKENQVLKNKFVSVLEEIKTNHTNPISVWRLSHFALQDLKKIIYERDKRG